MFRRLNSEMRRMFFVFGGLFLLLALIARSGEEANPDDGFQTKEFDDIW